MIMTAYFSNKIQKYYSVLCKQLYLEYFKYFSVFCGSKELKNCISRYFMPLID